MHWKRWRKYGDPLLTSAGPVSADSTRQWDLTPIERFMAKVAIDDDGCWEWAGATISTGYGVINTSDRGLILAHRWSWEYFRGPIPAEKPLICHHCDNPPCVRPDHLFVGTNQDNSDDKWAKGRGHGQRQPGTYP